MKKIMTTPVLLAAFLLFCNSACNKDTNFISEVLLIEEEVIDTVSDTVTPQDTINNTGTGDRIPTAKKTNGATYCGPYTVSAPLVLSGLKDTIIRGLKISNPTGAAIRIVNSENVIIEECFIHNSKGNGVTIGGGSKNITVRNVRMDSVSTGVYAQDSYSIVVEHIEVKNVFGPKPRGQLVQYNQVSGAGNKINYNILENIEGESYGEDAINLFKAHGTAESPLEIFGNWVRGKTPSLTGGGIMTGDAGGSHIWVKDNIIINPGGYGIAIASGTNITIENNYVYSDEMGTQWNPIYVANWSRGACSNNIIRNNNVHWKTTIGTLQVMKNVGGCGIIEGWDTNNLKANFDASILPQNILLNCN